MRLFLICFLICHSAKSIAQTPEKVLQQLLEPFLQSHQLYYENVMFYFEEGSKLPADSLRGIFHRNNGMEYMQLGDIEVLETGALTITVDHEEQIVAVRKITQTSSIDEIFDVGQLKSLVETRKMSVQFGQNKSNASMLILRDLTKPDEQMSIRYDPQTWVMREVIIKTTDPFVDPFASQVGNVTIVIRFESFTNVSKPFKYKTEQYVQKKGNAFVGSGKCKGYTVL